MTNNLRAKKSLGQNFLKDPGYVRRIADAARVQPGDQVLEIGPGLGHLTRELCGRAGKVLCIELDDRLIAPLRAQFADAPNVEIVHADALEYPFDGLAGTWKVVANLPYYISTPIIQRLLACRSRFASLTLMLQKEVAVRICAAPGGREYGYLSVLVQFCAKPSIALDVPAGAFTPRPKVDSAVVTMLVRREPLVPADGESFFLQVARAAFSQKRKTLSNTVRIEGVDRDAAIAALTKAGIDPSRRAETLSIAEFVALANELRSGFGR